jgi:hypothetical protein
MPDGNDGDDQPAVVDIVDSACGCAKRRGLLAFFCTTKPKLMEMKFFETIPSSRYQKDLA